MNRISKKRLSKLGGKVPFSTLPQPKKGIRKKKRKPSEFARIYGSKERVEFIKSLPCAACLAVGFSQNAHLLGNGGAGRKKSYTTVGPLCGGCHEQYDEHRWAFNIVFPDFDPIKVSAETETAWLAYQSAGQPKGVTKKWTD